MSTELTEDDSRAYGVVQAFSLLLSAGALYAAILMSYKGGQVFLGRVADPFDRVVWVGVGIGIPTALCGAVIAYLAGMDRGWGPSASPPPPCSSATSPCPPPGASSGCSATVTSASEMSGPIVIVTRGSPLALQQTHDAAARLQAALGRPTEIRILTTTGDRQASWSLEKQGGKGLFTAELEQALLRGEADLAIHSSKDLPTEMPAGLAIAVCLPRQDARDVLVRRTDIASPKLIATGSPRRRAQGALAFPQAQWTELRGNVDTRLKKLANGDADASYLAASGLNRLGIKEWPGLSLEPVALTDMVPAAGQGAVAIQSRSAEVARYAAAGCAATTYSVAVERLFLAKLGEGCHTAFACHHAAGRVHLYRADFGRRDFAFPVTDLAAASALADDILRQILPR